MYPVAVIRVWRSRRIHHTPGGTQIIHKILIGHLVQQTSIPRLLYKTTGEHSRYKVDELGTHKGEVSLNVRLIQALIIFILLEDEFQYPSFIVTKVSGLRIHIKIRFEYDDPEDEPFLFILMTIPFRYAARHQRE